MRAKTLKTSHNSSLGFHRQDQTGQSQSLNCFPFPEACTEPPGRLSRPHPSHRKELEGIAGCASRL